MPSSNYYVNCHAHCFTLNHVPEHFFDELAFGKHILDISKLSNGSTRRKLVNLASGKAVRWFIRIFSKSLSAQLGRLHGLLNYAVYPIQEKLIENLYVDYLEEYRLLMLSMDMDNMGAGTASKNFMQQLAELKAVKQQSKWKDVIYPFIFADPHRVGIDILVKQYLEDKTAPFQGIKLYPAMGYFPFDAALKSIYQYAIDNDVPVLTHCIVGDVHQRAAYYKIYPTHPISGLSTTPANSDLDYTKPENFQINFTHPLNYECLLNPAIATQFFGTPTDFSNLKICIAHFGGGSEWQMFKDQEAKSSGKYKNVYDNDPLDITKSWLGGIDTRYNWLKIIKALMRKYPNVYADISYTLHDESIYPMLKSMLKDETLKHRILYGTDYYVVASEKDEPDIIKLMKSKLSNDEIELIAHNNAINFLSSKLNTIT